LNSFPKEGSDIEKQLWNEKIPEKLAKLLSEMSKLLGYDFDETLLIKSAYAPVAHGFLDSEQAALRKGLVEIFAFKNPLKIELVDKN
ncbi:MAG TPA: DUF6680 family protein, partial [Gammaproteobacteria bacterium]|nr:DUF6680 family protein [Gammaproteobacteria bacterium]